MFCLFFSSVVDFFEKRERSDIYRYFTLTSMLYNHVGRERKGVKSKVDNPLAESGVSGLSMTFGKIPMMMKLLS